MEEVRQKGLRYSSIRHFNSMPSDPYKPSSFVPVLQESSCFELRLL